MSEAPEPPFISRLRPAIEEALRAAAPQDGVIAEAVRYVMGWDGKAGAHAGKRLRPVLCLLAAEACGASTEDAMPGAIALEYVHNFSLVHDDIQDRDQLRHHRPTAWRIYGEAQAINLGDYLVTVALEPLIAPSIPPERSVAAVSALNTAIARMIEGQWRDLSFEQRAPASVDEYLAMVAGKSGALLGASAEIGAILAGAPAPTCEALRAWGVAAGLAFQARDDYLGTWGDGANTGKSTTSDLARRKQTLPVVIGFQREEARQALQDLFAAPSADGHLIEQAFAALTAAGVDGATNETAARLREDAGLLLDAAPVAAPARSELDAFARYAISRAG